jgi:EAL domain-containing protein (putative c-di-GMP-specific phosphodiesterase class I)
MLTAYNSIVDQHDLRLVALAALVCGVAELEFLKSEFCNEAQGFLVGRPAAIEGFRMLTHGTDRPDRNEGVIPLAPRVASM